MSMFDSVTPSLSQLIAENTIHFEPTQAIMLHNDDFEAIADELKRLSDSDWYLQSKVLNEDKDIVKCYFRLKTHQLVSLCVSNQGYIYTVFMKASTAKHHAELVQQIVNNHRQIH